mmetsp:Transcript_21083/g.81816  ORF Transcript_21083/g.81816 Transcript_21083/m.81816 type:complete len:308 (+) Transcript_21083:184-1107(+)
MATAPPWPASQAPRCCACSRRPAARDHAAGRVAERGSRARRCAHAPGRRAAARSRSGSGRAPAARWLRHARRDGPAGRAGASPRRASRAPRRCRRHRPRWRAAIRQRQAAARQDARPRVPRRRNAEPARDCEWFPSSRSPRDADGSMLKRPVFQRRNQSEPARHRFPRRRPMRLQVLLERRRRDAHRYAQQRRAGQQNQQRMHADRQRQVSDPGQHRQRHQAGSRPVVDEARFAPGAEAAHVAAHKAIHQAGEGRHQEQRQGQDQHQQPHEEHQHRVGRGDQVALHVHVELTDVVAEVLYLAVRTGA